jgi:acyl-CoA reductase-like NAD-dependent aldehyde dehydrogenase
MFKPAPRLKLNATDRENARRLAWRYMSADRLAHKTPHEVASILWTIYSLTNPEGEEIAEIITKARGYAETHLSPSET